MSPASLQGIVFHWTTKEVPKRLLKVQLWRTGEWQVDVCCSIFRPHKGQGWWDKTHVFAKHWKTSLLNCLAFRLDPCYLVCLSQTSWFELTTSSNSSMNLGHQLWMLAALSADGLFHFREASFLGLPAKEKVNHLPDIILAGLILLPNWYQNTPPPHTVVLFPGKAAAVDFPVSHTFQSNCKSVLSHYIAILV